MADLESKLLGGEAAGYCSSSSKSDDDECDIVNRISTLSDDQRTAAVSSAKQRNTGPKGVIDDYNNFQTQLQKKELEQHEKMINHSKYCTLSGDLNDYLSIRAKRWRELKDHYYAVGKITEFTEKEDYLDFIESNRDCWILIHIYDEENEGCITLNRVFNMLIQFCSDLKLARVLPSVVGMSLKFKENALPALQVYRNGVLRGNFVRITDQLGEKFTAEELENFLLKNEIDLRGLECPANSDDDCDEGSTTDD